MGAPEVAALLRELATAGQPRTQGGEGQGNGLSPSLNIPLTNIPLTRLGGPKTEAKGEIGNVRGMNAFP